MARRTSPRAQRALAFLFLRTRPERPGIVVRPAHAPGLARASHSRLRPLASGGGRSRRGHCRGLRRRPDRGLPRRRLPGRGLPHPGGSLPGGLLRDGLPPHSPPARSLPGRLPRYPGGLLWRRLSGTRPAPARGTPCGLGLPLCSHAHPPFRPGVGVPSITKGTTHRVFFAARNSCHGCPQKAAAAERRRRGGLHRAEGRARLARLRPPLRRQRIAPRLLLSPRSGGRRQRTGRGDEGGGPARSGPPAARRPRRARCGAPRMHLA